MQKKLNRRARTLRKGLILFTILVAIVGGLYQILGILHISAMFFWYGGLALLFVGWIEKKNRLSARESLISGLVFFAIACADLILWLKYFC